MMNQLFGNSLLFGGNAPFVEELYENYLDNPGSVSDQWREYFDKLAQLPGYVARDVPHLPVINAFAELARKGGYRAAAVTPVDDRKQVSVLQMITSYRFIGDRWANLDPLKRTPRPEVPQLDPAYYGLSDADLNTVFNAGSFKGTPDHATFGQIYDALKATYCGSIGVEYMYISTVAEKRWIQDRLERIHSKPNYTAEQRRRMLERLTAAETLERYLHTRYVGQKRFSLEGGESTIVAMDELIRVAGAGGVDEIVVGMAHRGRLNVLVNTLGKAPSMLFDEFEGKKAQILTAGDVKYHMGYSSDVSTPGGPCHLTLAFNPSHLEIVNPVVVGSVYSRQRRRGENGKDKVLSVLIHGDAAVAGQGVNQEMLNFAQTRGYGVGGTVHIVINNQIGFTTSDPRDYRSSLYCTDIFKMAEAPIFHVNGDDPEAVALVTSLAVEFRKTFKKDVVVDIVCYRKLGHNEQDEPMVTQPLMYKKIQQHPGTRKLYADKLVAEGVLHAEGPNEIIADYRAHLDRGELLYNPVLAGYKHPMTIDWTPFVSPQYIENCDTKVPVGELQRLSERLTTIPPNFTLHSRVQKIIEDRRQMGEGKLPVDWGMAENLAYASLLVSGYGVRISGEDVGRSTFFHRHAALHDQNREHWDHGTYYPLANLQERQGGFQCFDSVLSEEAVLAFEYGYSTANPHELVVWEAQFGDFANGAQVVIDQFIAAGEAKWGRASGLVLLLPHGYEGQGPEHSSARIERYMQLCAEMNMEVCQPSTPAQVFHMLRRQALRSQRKPLIVFSPKSLLRHKDATSTLEELSDGEFQRVIGEVEPIIAKKVTRVIFCSGKIYYELVAARHERKVSHVAIARLEQLYPFPQESFQEELAKYPKATEVVWCQDEPRNQGAWYWIASRQHLSRSLSDKQHLLLVSRPASASPAVGYQSKHNAQQKALIDSAFGEIEYYKLP
ncbi:MAG: 2-oxoglutarate dehydrogenase E1 component [Candidatus Accumulibacter phosphatis]|uniref:2-oxoglutarate dehydrogenase E1 component n=2 Tax=Candidatus Accumulibacter TaxID=327159 RepID=A0A080M9G1_9PROT|nr:MULTISPECIES: 2-oxoglutarate dehydrogenase E1 component [Candidatus Accumulibacter]KFB77947.1 MAG: 2-oxoglutarate dehydrogenase E1 component [Candidatus Accumulibacter cognatus]MBL8399666.1 2-oxoglutarate dehydrogenase E1 component [Accumulibacter sp.]MBN8519404.1 2-oxoglutarate dehydrogenase E1 component [Accumulibacter sp.]MBO3710821.1 2-oxoglutarate dehydrogenase E1 component [Accumulibacter sp.]MCC2868021.1 2-oxoglutarate dehydrogenase E1 component [Candidatus Accumulibacter phosphatis]